MGAKAAAWREANLDRKREMDAAYYEAHRLEMNAAGRANHARNRERDNAAARAWNAANREKVHTYNRQRRQEDGDAIRAARREHYRQNKARYVAQARGREERIQRATPAWADREAIIAVYEEAARLTAETGVPHHVDHEIPLRGKTVSGLHVETNLRIIPAAENLSKSNTYQEAA